MPLTMPNDERAAPAPFATGDQRRGRRGGVAGVTGVLLMALANKPRRRRGDHVGAGDLWPNRTPVGAAWSATLPSP